VLNPVRAGMVAQPEKWQWSSYRSTAFAGTVPEYLTIDWVLGQFAENKTEARQRYRGFVADGLNNQVSPWQKLTGQVFLGSESFVARMREFLGDRQEIKEIPRAQRYPGRPPLDLLFADLAQGDRQQRNNQVVQAHITHGYILKEIADCLGIKYTTVSKIVAGARKKVIFQDLTPIGSIVDC
ncbi:MAG: hypothetical protein WCA04_07940, partial [Geobacteraceae bacterium]